MRRRSGRSRPRPWPPRGAGASRRHGRRRARPPSGAWPRPGAGPTRSSPRSGKPRTPTRAAPSTRCRPATRPSGRRRRARPPRPASAPGRRWPRRRSSWRRPVRSPTRRLRLRVARPTRRTAEPAMTEQAEAQSRAAEERAAEADQARGSVAVETAQFVRQTEKAPAADDWADKTKGRAARPRRVAGHRRQVGDDEGRAREGDPTSARRGDWSTPGWLTVLIRRKKEVRLAPDARRGRRRGRRHGRQRDRLVDQAPGGQVT